MADRGSRLDRAVGTSVGVLIAAAAVYLAVRLVEAVWMALLIILIVCALVVAAVSYVRARNRTW